MYLIITNDLVPKPEFNWFLNITTEIKNLLVNLFGIDRVLLIFRLAVSLIYYLAINLKCTCSHLGFCIFVLFSTFRDEIQYFLREKRATQYIFLVKNSVA